MNINPLLMTDGYKVSHHKMYPERTTLVYSNFTPRGVGYMPKQAKNIVVFGIQYTIKYIKDLYDKNFFSQLKDQVISEAKVYLDNYLGTDYDMSHFEVLHDLGYLPIEVKSLLEGSITGPKIPVLTIKNTLPEFFWLPNFLETLISSLLWKPMHSASLAYGFKKIVNHYRDLSDKHNEIGMNFILHDFSFRGMQHPESAISSALGFLTCSMGTDTIPVLQAAKYYYNTENVGFSVPASEHAVMTAYGKEDEIGAFRRLMSQYPTGILSIVSDSFDLWKVCTEYMVELKDEILARDGKIVLRPDSGLPEDIICGKFYPSNDPRDAMENSMIDWSTPENKGVVELLWDVFGGTINDQGMKVLDPHIGVIYGDSINLDRCEIISQRLIANGFASTNIVYGVGSYSLGYATRDSQGSAVKATYVEVDGIGREIFKDPITDDGLKKSAKGLLQVKEVLRTDSYGKLHHDHYELKDQCTWEEENTGALKTIFKNGELINKTNLNTIRERINKTL